jgi:hypothetical protein
MIDLTDLKLFQDLRIPSIFVGAIRESPLQIGVGFPIFLSPVFIKNLKAKGCES